MAPNKKIHLTYLWADESVMLEDFGRKISRGMTEWANDFYQPYGFELDVQPGTNVGKVALAHKFALEKNNGIRPDFHLDSAIKQDFDRRMAVIEREIEAKKKQIEILKAEHDRIPESDSAGRARAHKRLMAAYDDELFPAYDGSSALYDELFTKLGKLHHEYELRMQMMFKFFIDKIGNGSRLNVVFCRFADDPGARKTTGNTFMTFSTIRSIVARKPRLYLWPYPFIALDIKENQTRVVAHEIVHAAGESHPSDQKIRTLQKVLEARPTKRTGGSMLDRAIDLYLDYESQFEIVDGGFFDGQHNSIMNYSLYDKDPTAYVLEDADKDLLERAFFVW